MKFVKVILIMLIATFLAKCELEKKGFENFISADNDKLKDGLEEFRFLSFNIPNLNFVEDEMEFTKPHPFRLPTSFEIRDALESVKQMGGTVVRSYTFPVKRSTDTLGIPRYITGPGEFDEHSFVVMDTVLSLANEIGIRLIVPLLNNWQWMGGRPQYAEFRNKTQEEFWTDPQLIDDFKKTVEFILNRTNTVTGIKYKDDKSILCWETGNELTCPYSWTKTIVSFIKSIDKNHLVMDGFHAIDGKDIPFESLEDTLIDIVTTHHYKLNPDEIIKDIFVQMKRVGGRKPYVIGEFGFLGTEAIRKISDFIINNPVSGGLVWSLRHHRQEGGFYLHSEPYGGDLYKAFHWPGFASGIEYNEEMLMPMYREKAFEIRRMELPDIEAPKAPKLLPISIVSEISWQGSAGAKYYDIERSESSSGPWKVAGYNVTDADQVYTPLFNDYSATIGKEYYYRVLAKNRGGVSDESNIVGPVKAESLRLLDEMKNFTVLYFLSGGVKIKTDRDREFKEITHRFEMQPGAFISYIVPGNIISIKLNSFSRIDSSSLSISVSETGEEFVTIDAVRESYFIGKGDYDYWVPSQYKAEVQGAARYVRIEAAELNQLGRVEINYK
jgi:hypothetical protein